jgi:hypothetical protein
VLRQSDVSGLIVQRTFLGNDYVERLCAALPELREGLGPELRIPKVPYLRWILSSGSELPPTIRHMSFLTDGAPTVSEVLLREMESEITPPTR